MPEIEYEFLEGTHLRVFLTYAEYQMVTQLLRGGPLFTGELHLSNPGRVRKGLRDKAPTLFFYVAERGEVTLYYLAGQEDAAKQKILENWNNEHSKTVALASIGGSSGGINRWEVLGS